MRKVFVFLAVLMLTALAAVAAPRTKAQMEAAARQAINQQRSARHLAPSNVPLKVLRSTEQVQVIGTEDGGFAVIAADDLISYGLEYRYLTQHLIGEISYEEMVRQLEIAIHQFAKRQMTYFRGMERRGVKIHWIDATRPRTEIVEDILRMV